MVIAQNNSSDVRRSNTLLFVVDSANHHVYVVSNYVLIAIYIIYHIVQNCGGGNLCESLGASILVGKTLVNHTQL